MLDSGSEDGFAFCGYLESFVVDVCCVFIWPWLPGCPMEVDFKGVSINESSEEMQVISFHVHSDKRDAVVGSKGEYRGSGESSRCEARMRGSGEWGTRDGHSFSSRVIFWEDVLEFVMVGDRGTCAALTTGGDASLNCKRCSLADRWGEGGTGDGFLWLVSSAFMHKRIAVG